MSLTPTKGSLHQKGTDPSQNSPITVQKVSSSRKEYAVSILYLTAILGLIVYVINQDLPKVGHDYGFFIAHMLDSFLHSKINGLGIQWYTANFGAGLPAYPNPQNIQYSLPQFFMLVINPWLALMMSLVTYSVIGLSSFYLFLREEMGWIHYASTLGASFILVNGFFIEHAIVGHVGFQTFPLLGAVLFLAFTKKIGVLPSGILIGLVVALIVNQAGFVLLTIFVPSLIILLLLIYLIRSGHFTTKVFASLLIGGASAVLLSISKISAVFAFMRFFPRVIEDDYGQTYWQGISNMIRQLTGFHLIVPYSLFSGKDLEEIPSFFQNVGGAQFGIWETNIFLSPGLLFLLLFGVGWMFFSIRKIKLGIPQHKIIAAALLFLAIWLAMDLTVAQGWLYNLLKPLPILRSLHVNVRFAAAFIYPLALLGAWIFHEAFKDKRNGSMPAFLLLGISTIATLFLYILIPQDVHNRSFNIRSALPIYAQIDKGANFTINSVAEITDLEVFDRASSNLAYQDPMFGYEGEYFRPKAVPGPVLDIRNGYYNFTNPASYVFPEENRLQPFDLFREDQKADLERLLSHTQPNLQISNWQKFANILNLIALAVSLLYLVFAAVKTSLKASQSLAKLHA